MTINPCAPSAAASAAAHDFDEVLQALEGITRMLGEAGLEAGGLSALTDWAAESARAFHDAAETWAVEVRCLEGLAVDLMAEVRVARERALWQTGVWCR